MKQELNEFKGISAVQFWSGGRRAERCIRIAFLCLFFGAIIEILYSSRSDIFGSIDSALQLVF